MTDITPARLRELAEAVKRNMDEHDGDLALTDVEGDLVAAALRAAADQREADERHIQTCYNWLQVAQREQDKLRATLAAREALLRRAMEGLTGMDFYSDRRALAAEIAAALNQEQDQ